MRVRTRSRVFEAEFKSGGFERGEFEKKRMWNLEKYGF